MGIIGTIIETSYNAFGKPVGCIEDVYGTGTSFNVLRRLEPPSGGFWRFYKSAYSLRRAKEHLAKLCNG